MSMLTILPHRLSGTVQAVSSKSAAHRAFICAALSDRPTAFASFVTNADIDATMACLTALGAAICPQDGGGCTLIPGEKTGIPQLDCGESGSTLRFLLPVAAVLGGASFFGHGRLPERKITPILEVLRAHGAEISSDSLPLTVTGRLVPGDYTLPGNVSSQYFSGLLFALPLLPGDSRIHVEGVLSSEGYIDLTRDTLSRFGVVTHRTEDGFLVPGNQRYTPPADVAIEGDWSGAAFYLAAGAIGAPVTVTGLRMDSAQRDREIAEILAAFGAQVEKSGDAVTVSPGALTGQVIDVDQIPDLFPILSILALAAQGETRLINAARLRDKESDRIAASAAMIRALGGQAEELPDELRIFGTGSLAGGTVDGAGDHRIVMSAAIASLLCREPVTIHGAEAVTKSYPGFFSDFQNLGGITHGITLW